MERKILTIAEINEILTEVVPTLKRDISIIVSTATIESNTKFKDPVWIAAHPAVYKKKWATGDDAPRLKLSNTIKEKYKDPVYAAKKKAAAVKLRIPKETYDAIYSRCFDSDRGGTVYKELSKKYGIDLNKIADIARGKHVWCDKAQYQIDIANWTKKFEKKGGITFDQYKEIYPKCFSSAR